MSNNEPQFQVKIACRTMDEAALLKVGLEDPLIRAFVLCAAALAPLPDAKSRLRAIRAAAVLLDIPHV
jgi:hypothetical protein